MGIIDLIVEATVKGCASNAMQANLGTRARRHLLANAKSVPKACTRIHRGRHTGKCEDGKYQPDEGQFACRQCSIGHYGLSTGENITRSGHRRRRRTDASLNRGSFTVECAPCPAGRSQMPRQQIYAKLARLGSTPKSRDGHFA